MGNLDNKVTIGILILALAGSLNGCANKHQEINSYRQDTIKTGEESFEVYNEKNKIIKSVIKKGTNNEIVHTCLFYYNDKGQRIKAEAFMKYKNEKPKLQWTEFYEYNKNGGMKRKN